MEERSIFGGLASTPYDPCYHTSCDTDENISNEALIDFSRIHAYVLQELADKKNLYSFLHSS